jgi:hypothetical protein
MDSWGMTLCNLIHSNQHFGGGGSFRVPQLAKEFLYVGLFLDRTLEHQKRPEQRKKLPQISLRFVSYPPKRIKFMT